MKIYPVYREKINPMKENSSYKSKAFPEEIIGYEISLAKGRVTFKSSQAANTYLEKNQHG